MSATFNKEGASKRGYACRRLSSKKKGTKRRWFMLVNCSIKRHFNFRRILIMIDLKKFIRRGANKQRGE